MFPRLTKEASNLVLYLHIII